MTHRTPGRFRTRVITQGVIPSLHLDYKHCRIKQYHKEGQALRTETTINDAYDFDIGRRLTNLSALRKVGFQANRRLLRVQRISHDAMLGDQAFARLQNPTTVQGQRAAGLPFGDPRVLAVLAALLVFRLLPRGFTNRDLREHLHGLRADGAAPCTPGRMTYDLRLHGLITRLPKSHRYEVTDDGFRTALFLTRARARLLRPGVAVALDHAPPTPTLLQRALAAVDAAISRIWTEQKMTASST